MILEDMNLPEKCVKKRKVGGSGDKALSKAKGLLEQVGYRTEKARVYMVFL